MKKILLVALAVLMCSVSFAQFRTAPREKGVPMSTKSLEYGTASNFTVTTLDNQTIELQDWLDSGYYVLLDISATWCSWCWYFHTAHILENVYQNYGPNGTNEIRVLWVEGDPSTSPSLIHGGSSSMGDWTAGVTYPIASDDNIADLFDLTGYPTVLFICPSGYYQDAYGACWDANGWTGNQFVTNTCVSAIYNLRNTCPAAGIPPIVEINGLGNAVINTPTSFSAEYVSIDPITSISWNIPGATPSTGTGDNITVTFPNTGSYTVTLEVTNTTGTTTKTLNVNVVEWTWGNTMSYDNNGSYASSVGGPTPMIWAAKYPATFMNGRNYLESVDVFAPENGTFTLMVYQTTPGVDASSSDLIYQYTYQVTGGDYNTLIPWDRVELDNTKDLWIAFSNSDISYPAAGVEYTGDPNGSLCYYQGAWAPIYELAESLLYTWMIHTTTSATAPALNVTFSGPTMATTNESVTFTAVGPAAATYSWSFDGGNPATATGMNATTSFATVGNHTVTLNVTLDGETQTVTHTINIINCENQNLPWSCGFESSDNFECWNFIDADGDGYGWNLNSGFSPRTDSGVAASASFINSVGVLYPDNWMITPKLNIPAEGATIEWWEYGQDVNDFADHYGVFAATNGNATSDFTYTIFEGAPVAAQTWRKHSFSLAGFAGQSIYLAFRHFNISNMYWLLIDDIKVTAGNTASISDVENANVSLYPNPVTNILHIDAQGIQEVNVIDINGRTVMSMQNTNTIDMSNLANGVYFVRVITTEGVSTQKITRK